MKYKLYQAEHNGRKEKSNNIDLDKLQLEILNQYISILKNKFKEVTQDQDILSMTEEELDLQTRQSKRYWETLNMLNERAKTLNEMLENQYDDSPILNLRMLQGTRPKRIYLGDDVYEVSSYADILVHVAEIYARADQLKFEQALEEIQGDKKRKYYSKNPEELRNAKKISNTNFQIEANHSSDQTCKLIIYLLESMKFDNDFFVEIQDK